MEEEIQNAEGNKEEQQNEVESLKLQIEDLTNKWKRAAADYQNLEKRIAREKEELLRFTNILLISRLIGVLDNLERASEHAEDKGLSIVTSDLKNILSEQGLTEINVKVGDSFDPAHHECVELTKGDSDDKVTEVVAKGYIIGDRVVRPAKVKVSKKDIEGPLLESGN